MLTPLHRSISFHENNATQDLARAYDAFTQNGWDAAPLGGSGLIIDLCRNNLPYLHRVLPIIAIDNHPTSPNYENATKTCKLLAEIYFQYPEFRPRFISGFNSISPEKINDLARARNAAELANVIIALICPENFRNDSLIHSSPLLHCH